MVDRIELNRRGLPHFVVVDADITIAARADLERRGLAYKVRVDADGNSVAPGVPPVLTSASAVDFSDIFVWGRATTDTASGTFYAVACPAAEAAPTAAQIAAGLKADGSAAPGSASLAITSIGAKDILVRGLTAVTAYKVHITHQSGASFSNVASTASFTTDTLVIAFATAGAATNMTASTGSAAFGLNQADPHGGTNALRWVDSNDTVTGQVAATCSVATFFNGVNKVHITCKLQGGVVWLRINTALITILAIPTHWNTSTGTMGTNHATWTPTPVIFDVGSGWWMWSGQANLAGADLAGQLTFNKSSVDNNLTCTRNGTNIQDLYNIRITRV